MYIAGNIVDFNSRMHQLPSTTGDVDSFVSEGNTYISSGILPQISGKWETEARRKYWTLSNNPNYLTINRFGASYLMVSDNFDSYPDGYILNSGNWGAPPAAEVFMMVTGGAVFTTTNNHHTYATWTGNTFTNDQYTQDNIVNVGPWNGVILRSTMSNDRFYMAFVFGANDYRFYLRSSGAYANIATYTGQTWVSGDKLKLAAYGYNPVYLYMYRNDILVASIVDTLYNITGGVPGIGLYNPDGFTLMDDNFVGGNAAPIGASPITSDNFQRADSDTLGVNWINGMTSIGDVYTVDSPRGFKIRGNKARVVMGVDQNSFAHPVASTFNTNHYSSIVVGQNTDGGDWQGPIIRSNYSSYYLSIVLSTLPNNASVYYYIYPGAFVAIASNVAVFNSGDTMRLQASGTSPVSLTLLKNEVPVWSGTDSTALLTGNRVGFAANFLDFNAYVAGWSGGNL